MKKITATIVIIGLIIIMGSIGNYDFYEETGTIMNHTDEINNILYCILGTSCITAGMLLNRLYEII